MTSENIIDSVPSLTLEPDLEPAPELVIPKQEAPQTQMAETVLTPEEQKVVAEFAAKIDIENTAQVLQYGAGAQKKMADFSDAALANVRTQDLGEVGDLIVDIHNMLTGEGEMRFLTRLE